MRANLRRGHPKSSPRTWGWTDRRPLPPARAEVVPTHVGVDRRCWPPTWPSGCRPHARGGGPVPVIFYDEEVSRPHARGGGPGAEVELVVEVMSSPRTWGWTGPTDGLARAYRVVPTHVGVDRSGSVGRPSDARRPHARGGGPWTGLMRLNDNESSPRTWGWTGGRGRRRVPARVVPTHVGVDRPSGTSACTTLASSPRTWGWTVAAPSSATRPRVVPTHVGVDRAVGPSSAATHRRPHARGGGPFTGTDAEIMIQSSPRTWGWTGLAAGPVLSQLVVPTHVGVDRERSCPLAELRGRPHARGGGPAPVPPHFRQRPSSPRTWGWTARS